MIILHKYPGIMQETYSILTTATPEKVWKMWSDVKSWGSWETSIKSAQLKRDFDKDSDGVLVYEKWPPTHFRIVSCVPNFTYTMFARLPLATLHIRRLIGYHNSKTIITNEIWTEGPLSSFWWRLIGRRYKAQLPAAMARFKALAES